jgi:hypothetical protein
MPLGLWSLIYSSILIINSLAILSNQRFLLPLGLSSSSSNNNNNTSYDDYNNNNNESIKHKIIHLVSAVRTLMRSKFIHYHFTITLLTNNNNNHKHDIVPLIPINIILILFEIITV